MVRVCFVCMGNICRSPTAEAVFKHLAAEAGLAGNFHVESAGLGAWHLGDPPDSRARRIAQAHGVALDGQARQFRPRDFDRFDVILALDTDIHEDLLRMGVGEGERRKVRMLRDYDPQATRDRDVPDPYYGDQALFEHAYGLIERSCRGLLAELSRDGQSAQSG